MNDAWSFETKQIHAGQQPDAATGARALPIYQTTSYAFRDTDHAAALFGLAELGNIYTRIMNPTQDVVEQRIAALEGGVGGAAGGVSGQAAETLAILNLAEVGDHIVSSPRALRRHVQPVPLHAAEARHRGHRSSRTPTTSTQWRAAVRPNTKAFFAETIANPKIDILDIAAVADVAHETGVPLIVDNTVATPYLIQPLEHGADIVVHSATKFLGGHGTAIAGVIVDGGTFDWAAHAERFPGFTTPDPSYHGLVYAEALGADRLHHQGARAAAARPRPGDRAVQRVPDRPGPRDAVACASSATCRTRRRSPSGSRPATRWSR